MYEENTFNTILDISRGSGNTIEHDLVPIKSICVQTAKEINIFL
jgi:hypothetical protein